MTEIYVATDGSDSNAGTIDSPITTMKEAIRNRASPGDTIVFRQGVYMEQFLIYFTNGEPEAPITVKAYQDEQVEFVGDHKHRIRANHIRVRGITFRDGEGMVIAKPRSHNVKFYDCESFNNTDDGFSVNEEAYDVEFHRCLSHHNYDEPISSEDGDRNADGFDVTLRAYDVRYYNCDAYHNVDDGFDTNQGGFGIELYGCRAWQNGLNPNEEPVGNGVGIKIQNGRNNTIDADPRNPTINARCVTWDNVSDGQRFYRAGGTCYALNLTSFDNGDDNYQCRDYGSKPNQYYYINCIAASGGSLELDASNQTDRNCTWTMGISDPGFVQSSDQAVDGFAQLQRDSPCIDAGTTDTEGVELDFVGIAPDLGAYEHSATLRVHDGSNFVIPRTVRFYDGTKWVNAQVNAFDEGEFLTALDGNA